MHFDKATARMNYDYYFALSFNNNKIITVKHSSFFRYIFKSECDHIHFFVVFFQGKEFL